ncbi:MAG: ADP-ribosylglycohydrolase family protein [Propionibacteriaceae bacterium]|jgi:ADP-ribosylglycohydrolase|nr:ADP-ribosylglycohydrolase family protein [Propionibacteriaceae bacterium]
MLGAIVGDIVGSLYEYKDVPPADFELIEPRSDWTDDTLMTLAVADGLMDLLDGGATEPDDMSDVVLTERIRRFAMDYDLPRGGYGSRFTRWLLSRDPHPYGSYGNGSAMRVSSVGWLFDTLEETERWAAGTARITHDHPAGIAGAQAIAASILLARQGASRQEIRDYVSERFYDMVSGTLADAKVTYAPTTSCQGTVPFAILAYLDATSFKETLRYAVGLGGDTDTLAAMAGSIAEVEFGVPDYLRQAALERLEPELREVLDRFWERIKTI